MQAQPSSPALAPDSPLCFFYYCYCFLYLIERERERTGERDRGRDRENSSQAPCSTQTPTRDLIPWPWDHDLSWNQESDAQLTEPPRCPTTCVSCPFTDLLYSHHLLCFTYLNYVTWRCVQNTSSLQNTVRQHFIYIAQKWIHFSWGSKYITLSGWFLTV